MISLAAIATVIAVFALSYRTNKMPNGAPIIISESEYNANVREASQLASAGVLAFNNGEEITDAEKADLAQSARLFDALDAFKPDEAAGFFEAGLVYYLIGDSDTALNRVQQSLNNSQLIQKLNTAQDRSNLEGVVGDCHHVISLIAFNRRQYQMARDEAGEALKHKQDRPLYYVARAQAEVQLSDVALADSKKAEARKDSATAAKNTAEAAKELTFASKDISDALKLNPNSVQAKRLKGLITKG